MSCVCVEFGCLEFVGGGINEGRKFGILRTKSVETV